jgi:plasmid rolling circle replication initiator protein Rep
MFYAEITTNLMKTISQETREVKPIEPWEPLFRFEDELNQYAVRKPVTLALADTYLRTKLPDREKKALDLRTCGRKIIWAEPVPGEPLQMVAAIFCQHRLCPLCQWRRSWQTFGRLLEVVNDDEFKGLEYLFLTLTVKNPSAAELPKTLDRVESAWRWLTYKQTRPFNKAFLGCFRSLEITYNKKDHTFHPHYHVLCVVPHDYFKKSNENYMSFAHLRALWEDALDHATYTERAPGEIRDLDRSTFGARLDLGPATIASKVATIKKFDPIAYKPEVRIQKVKDNPNKKNAALYEVAKYVVKGSDLLNEPEAVEAVDRACFHRRFIASTGLFKKVRAKIGGQDEICAIDTDRFTAEELLGNPVVRKIMMTWNFGAKVYEISEYE